MTVSGAILRGPSIYHGNQGLIPKSHCKSGVFAFLSYRETLSGFWIATRVTIGGCGVTGGVAKSPLLRFNSRRNGFANSVNSLNRYGTDHFHRELIDVFGAGIRHEASWIIRYSRVAPPMFCIRAMCLTKTVQIYNTQCSEIDPFSRHWKNRGSAGVLTLSQLNSSTHRIRDIQQNISSRRPMSPTKWECFFRPSDTAASACSLSAKGGIFPRRMCSAPSSSFRLSEGYHRAHLERLFNDLRYTNATEVKGLLIERPTMIPGVRFGVEVYIQ